MDEGSWTAGLLFQAAARVRRAALMEALAVHGMEDLEPAMLTLLDGEGAGLAVWEGEQLLRLCRVVDQRMLAGFSGEERTLLCAFLKRLLTNLHPR